MRKIILLLLCIVLTGCCPQNSPDPPCRVVSAITAEYNSGGMQLRRNYTDQKKMRAILDYLRLLSPVDVADGYPSALSGQTNVTLHFSDGSQRVYTQTGDGFFRKDGNPWQRIDPEKGKELQLLLSFLESDEIF